MKTRNLLACALSCTLALTVAATSVFAASFSDVDNDSTVSWAKDSIQTMTNSGYIKGYEDGTFKPYRSISKMECLLLMSRMLGVEESSYADVAEAAEDAYGATVRRYNTTYVTELCYLLYNGIITESDLAAYASSANANTELLRYQAAMLMSKLLGANSEASRFTAATPTYPDDAQIPAAAKPYVEYVTRQSIMNGMASSDGTATVFSPNSSLTRAQMATLLSRMLSKINKSYYTGTISALNLNNNSITITRSGNSNSRSVNDDTVAYYENERISVDDLETNQEVGVLEIGGHIQMIAVLGTNIDPSESDTVYATIASLNESSNTKRITLADPEDSDNTASYNISSGCTFTSNNSKATFNDLKRGDFVKVTINNGAVIAIEVTAKDFVVNGTLKRVDFDDSDHVYVIIEEDGAEQTYTVSNKGATVVRDSSNSEYRALSAGDSVRLTLSSGKVTRISATSSTTTFTGVLSEIHITATPYVTLIIDGKAREYKLRSDAEIKIAGANATIYDLRRNISVSGALDGSEVKSLSASSVSISENGQLEGTVSGINTSYKVINVTDDAGNLLSVYYNNKTNFLMSNGQSTTARSIEKGASVTITGAEKNGVFEAAIIIVK